MNTTREYLVPDYYCRFSCKMGACRSACCTGWPISFSLNDYFRLMGSACSPQLRDRLDRGVRIALEPTPEVYAQIAPRWDGECPMRLEDGRCAIHAELGSDALSLVCRLYPRGVRREHGCECSCANSCEAVLELLLAHREPIRFEKQTLTFDLPEEKPRTVTFETVGREQDIRLWLISRIQNRALHLPGRLMSLGLSMKSLEEALNDRDAGAVDALLMSQPAAPEVFPADERHLETGLKTMESLMELLDERSNSIRACGEAALAYFRGGDGEFDRYLRARDRFEAAFPEWETWFEHMLVNHMFFERFPFQDRPDRLWNEFVALCAVYALLRFLCLGCACASDDASGMVDVCAAAFRLIDHTEFDRYASRMLVSLGCSGVSGVHDLIIL